MLGYSAGKLNTNVAPLLFELFEHQILPSCASMMLLEMSNPSPVHLSDFVANLLKCLGMNWINSRPAVLGCNYCITVPPFNGCRNGHVLCELDGIVWQVCQNLCCPSTASFTKMYIGLHSTLTLALQSWLSICCSTPSATSLEFFHV